MFQWVRGQTRTIRWWSGNCPRVLTEPWCCRWDAERARGSGLSRQRLSIRRLASPPSRPGCRRTSGRSGRAGATVRGCVVVESRSEHDDAFYEAPAGKSTAVSSVITSDKCSFVMLAISPRCPTTWRRIVTIDYCNVISPCVFFFFQEGTKSEPRRSSNIAPQKYRTIIYYYYVVTLYKSTFTYLLTYLPAYLLLFLLCFLATGCTRPRRITVSFCNRGILWKLRSA